MIKVKELPKQFNTVKVEFEKRKRMFTASGLDDSGKKVETLEDQTLLYLQMLELEEFISEHVALQGTKVLKMMDENNNHTVLLPEYGKKLYWDKEAQWLFPDDMTSKDWEDNTKKSNEVYLESLSKNKSP